MKSSIHGNNYAVTSPDLVVLNEEARSLSLNRSLPEVVLDNLDPAGMHILSPIMVHRHADGKPVTPHLRCFVLLKFAGQIEPPQMMLDVPVDQLSKVLDMSEAELWKNITVLDMPVEVLGGIVERYLWKFSAE